jgi:hypothetical protein
VAYILYIKDGTIRYGKQDTGRIAELSAADRELATVMPWVFPVPGRRPENFFSGNGGFFSRFRE